MAFHKGQRVPGNVTIGDYTPGSDRNWKLTWSSAVAGPSWDYAKRQGWTVRTERHRGFIKVFDKEGNVTFSNRTIQAIWGHRHALQLCKELSHIYDISSRLYGWLWR